MLRVVRKISSKPSGKRRARVAAATAESLGSYTIRAGTDGKIGIYLRDYNVRLATFNSNTDHCQRALQRVFDLVASGQLSC
jgi:hypothetical protein